MYRAYHNTEVCQLQLFSFSKCYILAYLFSQYHSVDDIKPPKILTRGASDDAKQKVTRALQEIQDRKNEIQPELERITREYQELQVEVQNSQKLVTETKGTIQSMKKTMNKLENSKRKLRELNERLETDNEEEKKQLVDRLKQRVLVSLKAMGAHSESYTQMMEATVKASGAKLNKEVTTVQERISRYVH